MRKLYSSSKYYDLFYTESAVGDSLFWRNIAAELPGPILELACGTGRVMLDLANNGHEVVGLDISEAMLATAMEKVKRLTSIGRGRVEFVHADMADFELGRKFGLIIIPFNAFQHLITTESQKGCLTAAYRHLANEGRFVVTLFNPNMHFIVDRARAKTRQFLSERVEPETGHTIRRYCEQVYNFPEQYFDCIFIYERIDQEGILQSTEFDPIMVRWTWRYEMEHMLNLVGFQTEHLYGNYQCVAFPEVSEKLIFVCKKAAG